MKVLKIDIHPKHVQRYLGNESIYTNWVIEASTQTDIYIDQGKEAGIQRGDWLKSIYRHDLRNAEGELLAERIELDYNLLEVVEVQENYALARIESFAYRLYFDRYLGQKLSKHSAEVEFMSLFPVEAGQELLMITREEKEDWKGVGELKNLLTGESQFTPERDVALYEGIIPICENYIKKYKDTDSYFLPDAYYEIGFAYHKLKEFEKSTKTLKLFLELFPNSPAVPGAHSWISENQLFLRQNAPVAKTTLLFLSANPVNSERNGLGQELREIELELSRAQMRDSFELVKEVAVTPRQLQQAFLDHNPDIVHFSGAGSEAGIILEDEKGNPQMISTDALGGIFQLMSAQISGVILNACYSKTQAQEISKHIPHVIGMNQQVSDASAIAFSVGFYKAIGAGKSIEFAFELGKNAIQLEGLSGGGAPELLVKKN